MSIGDSPVQNMTLQDLYNEIEYNTGVFPREVLLELINRKAEAIPFLLNILEETRRNAEKYAKDFYYSGHVYAAYFLSQFRITEAQPILIDLLKLPSPMPHSLFGDMVCESAGRILASTYANDIEPIKELIENPQIDAYVRSQGFLALVILVLNGLIERSVLMDYCHMLFNGALADRNKLVISEIAALCTYLYPKEIYEDIKKAYICDSIDPEIINISTIEKVVSSDKSAVLDSAREEPQLQFITDIIKELEKRPCFHVKPFDDFPAIISD